ncbi:MAG: hypothetical protein HYV14_11010 [Elusimicrobia bacterium]|nr:hypothetical protein [Elusimicrobiota bacterium]
MLHKSVAAVVSVAVLIGGPGLTAPAAAQTMTRGAAVNVSVTPSIGAGFGGSIPGAPSLSRAIPLSGVLAAPSPLSAPAVAVNAAVDAAPVPAAAALAAIPAPSAPKGSPAAAPKAALRALADASARAAAVGDRFFDQSAPAAPEAEIVLIRTLPAEDGRRGTGHDQSAQLEALVQRSEGKIKSLERDGPFSLFQETFAVEIKASARAEILAELGAIAGIEFHSLSDLLSAAARREPRPLPDAERFAAYAGRLDKGSLAERLGAFAELGSALESAAPEQVAALPVEARDAVAVELYDLAAVAVNTFNLVQGAARQDIRKRLHDERAERPDGWAGLEKAAQEGLKDPAVRARFEPLRTMLVRTLGAMDRLNTPGARALVMQMLPHAEHAGLEFVAARRERRALYIGEWLGTITGSLDETLEGMRLGAARPEGWTGSNRSGGYTHVEGRRQSMHLYQWKRGRFDPAEMRHELLLTLGMPDGASLVDLLLPALEAIQNRVPQMDSLNRENRIGEELRNLEGRLAGYAAQAEQNGRPMTPEQIDGFRRDLTEQLVSRYDEHDKIDGHSVVDRLLLSLSYSPFHAVIPGFDEAVYVANALRFFHEAHGRVSEPGLLKQLADAAVGFLTGVANAPVLDFRPELRAQAVATWKALAAKARAAGITLNTRMDGVIDPRPQKLLGEPALLDDAGKDATTWQIAISPGDRWIARAAGDRSVKIWDARTKALLKTIQLDDARQLYGDLANSLGVAWAADGRLLVTTLHDGEEGGRKFSYNMVRSFDLTGDRDVLTPADAVSAVRIPDVYVLREMTQASRGPLYATMKELRNEQQHYLGAEVRLVGADGVALSLIENATLLSLRGDALLTAAPGKSQPSLRLWDLFDPRRPLDATPEWLKERVAAWRARNPRSKYGWWPTISAKLGTFQDRPALILHDEGKIQLLDLQTGAVLRSIEVPNDWDVAPYLADEKGRYMAAVVKAPGQFSGPNPERLMVWDLSTGELVMELDATYVPQGWVYSRGQSIGQLLFSRDGRRLIAAGRQSVQIFDLP